MFYECTRLKTFNADLSSLNYAYCMFASCSELTSFNSDLRSLTNGTAMFQGCKLNESSLQNIANTINNVTGISPKPGITMGTEHSLEELTDSERMSLKTIMEKGWAIQFGNSSNGDLTLDQLGFSLYPELDIVEGSAYIPDASTWNDAFVNSGIVVTSVHDGSAWDDRHMGGSGN